MLHFDEILFGPIVSRRLGSSLGVNILPSKGKLCNFDCIYCECGWNHDGKNNHQLPTFEEVKAALESGIPQLAEKGVAVDSITFSGNGEPTIHPDFAEIVEVVIRLRNEYYPEAKVSVLSNATMLGKQEVRDALKKVNNPILKIDAADQKLIEYINKPVGNHDLEETIAWLKEFDGDFILQTMFLKSPDFDLSEPSQINAWMDIVRLLKPREVMVYTIDRETPDKTLSKYTVQQMRELISPLFDEGFDIQIRG